MVLATLMACWAGFVAGRWDPDGTLSQRACIVSEESARVRGGAAVAGTLMLEPDPYSGCLSTETAYCWTEDDLRPREC
jgi:hypothetical protein